MSRYGRDPYWLNARFTSTCSKCGKTIKKGERLFYYPNGKKALCGDDKCGGAASADFASCAMDEATMNGGCW